MEKLELVEVDSCVGDNLSASIDYEGKIAISVEEPWAGDTETGFGRSGSIRLTREQALTLALWLVQAADGLSDER